MVLLCYICMFMIFSFFFRLLVAGYVGQNPQGHNLNLRHTTLMPNIHGLPSLIALMFAPKIELRYVLETEVVLQ